MTPDLFLKISPEAAEELIAMLKQVGSGTFYWHMGELSLRIVIGEGTLEIEKGNDPLAGDGKVLN